MTKMKRKQVLVL